MSKPSTRRRFLEHLARGTLLGALGTVAALCGLGRRRGDAGTDRAPNGPPVDCGACPILTRCTQPQALAFRSDRDLAEISPAKDTR